MTSSAGSRALNREVRALLLTARESLDAAMKRLAP